MTILRQLKEEDAPLMLEWMHDPDIQKGFKKRMMDATLDDCIAFIKGSPIPDVIHTGDSLNFAIADQESDTYLGTVSLKNIDIENGTAEYAIITRKQTQHKGIAYRATMQVLKKAFDEIGLHRVYLSVYADNAKAIKLYEKCGFRYEGIFRDHFLVGGKRVDWKWYGILAEEFAEG